MSKSPDWKNIRKHTMICSVNTFVATKYFKLKSFRNYIHARIASADQLYCSIHSFDDISPFFENVISISNIGHLALCGVPLEYFPSSPSLISLQLCGSSTLTGLGNYPNLECIKLFGCENLQSFGTMEKLKDLFLNHSCPLALLPLASLECLDLCGHIELIESMFRLRKLKKLHIVGNYRSDLPQLPFVLLEELEATHFRSIDITGLYKLKSLKFSWIPIVKGKDDIFPQLKVLKGSIKVLVNADLRNCLNLRLFHSYPFHQLDPDSVEGIGNEQDTLCGENNSSIR
jgi:hypothetical protein